MKTSSKSKKLADKVPSMPKVLKRRVPTVVLRQRPPILPALLVFWLAALTVFVFWMGFYYVKPMWEVSRGNGVIAEQSASQLENRYNKPVVDVTNKRIILPDVKLSMAHDPSLGEIRYQSVSFDSTGRTIVLTNEKVIREATARYAQMVDTRDPRKSTEDMSESQNSPYECQGVMSLKDRINDNKKPLATVTVDDTTWYAYAATDKNCSEFWSQDAYGTQLGTNGLLNKFVEMAKTAQPSDY